MAAKYQVQPIKGGSIYPPLLRLVLAIIHQAQRDATSTSTKPMDIYHKKQAQRFFASSYYQLMLDYLSAHMADVDLPEGALPEGVKI